MKRLFDILPEDFFKPLTSKYKQEYADCIILMFNSFKSEISYGTNRELIAKLFTDYFDADDREMTFDEEDTYVADARDKANGVISMLRSCGWIEYEQDSNHQINVLLQEYAVPVIESMNRIIKEEEAEYQGIISQIHASLQNKELYSKPYELIIKGVQENTDRLLSELKKLNVSIKRHMDKQTNDMDADQILQLFFEYHQNIGSKAYLRMKTSENISYFRTAIIEKLEYIMESPQIMERAVHGFMEVEEQTDEDIAYENLTHILMDIKSSFYRLDDVIEEIERKHSRYMRNAVMRARFLLATGNNMEGKLSKVLNCLVEEINGERENMAEMQRLFSIFPQNYLSPESLQTIAVRKKLGNVDELSEQAVMSHEERRLFKEALQERNRKRFSRKNINQYVVELLGDRQQMPVTDVPVKEKKDLIRLVYVSIYAGNKANNYTIKRTREQVRMGEYSLPYFDIIRRD